MYQRLSESYVKDLAACYALTFASVHTVFVYIALILENVECLTKAVQSFYLIFRKASVSLIVSIH